jgi:hypothetical protein
MGIEKKLRFGYLKLALRSFSDSAILVGSLKDDKLAYGLTSVTLPPLDCSGRLIAGKVIWCRAWRGGLRRWRGFLLFFAEGEADLGCAAGRVSDTHLDYPQFFKPRMVSHLPSC